MHKYSTALFWIPRQHFLSAVLAASTGKNCSKLLSNKRVNELNETKKNDSFLRTFELSKFEKKIYIF